MVFHPRTGISLCSGGGGLELGVMLAEPAFKGRCFVEFEPDAQAVLVAGMLGDDLPGASEHGASTERLGLGDTCDRYAKVFEQAAVWGDVRTFVGDGWRGHIDLICAGYPCQPFSAAGKRLGAADPRHLWPDVARICVEVGPEWIFLENVAGHISEGLETVLRDLWDMGYTPAVGLFSAQEVGGSHERQRIFILAHRRDDGRKKCNARQNGLSKFDGNGGEMADANSQGTSTDSGKPDPGTDRGNDVAGCGRTAVDDAGCTKRRSIDAEECDSNRHDAQRETAGGVTEPSGALGDTSHDHDPRGLDGGASGAASGGSETGNPGGRKALHGQRVRSESCGAGDDVGDPSGFGRGKGRSQPEFRGGRDTSVVSGSTLADACQPGLQGREQPGSPEQRDGALAYGSVAERGRPWLFPPGPSGEWGEIIAINPSLAPSLALGDIIRRTRDLAAMAAQGGVAQTASERDLCRMADGMAARPRALRLLGNGVVPLVAAYAFRTLGTAHGLWPVDLDAAD